MHQKHDAERLAALEAALGTDITRQTSEASLRLAASNIMHFGNGRAYLRRPESLLYIAEIIDRFDLVAVEEASSATAPRWQTIRQRLTARS